MPAKWVQERTNGSKDGLGSALEGPGVMGHLEARGGFEESVVGPQGQKRHRPPTLHPRTVYGPRTMIVNKKRSRAWSDFMADASPLEAHNARIMKPVSSLNPHVTSPFQASKGGSSRISTISLDNVTNLARD